MSNKKAIPIVEFSKGDLARQEFARAGVGGQFLCTVFYQLLKNTKDHSQAGRLSSKLLQIIQTDTVHDLGNRKIMNGDLSLLEGFDFYKKHQLARLLPDRPAVSIDRQEGRYQITTEPFIPIEWMPGDINATHISFVCAAATLDFGREKFVVRKATGDPTPVNKTTTASFVLELPKASSLPIVVVVGLQFLKVVNGKAYPMSGSCVQIVKVDKGPELIDNKKVVSTKKVKKTKKVK